MKAGWGNGPVGRDSGGRPDHVGHFAEALQARALNGPGRPFRESGAQFFPPYSPQPAEFAAEHLERVMDVQSVLRLLRAAAVGLDEELLRDEAYRVRQLHVGRARERQAESRVETDGPWIGEKEIQVPQLLRGHTCSLERGVRGAIPPGSRAKEWRQKLHVEAVPAAKHVLGDGRDVLSREFLPEAGRFQRLPVSPTSGAVDEKATSASCVRSGR